MRNNNQELLKDVVRSTAKNRDLRTNKQLVKTLHQKWSFQEIGNVVNELSRLNYVTDSMVFFEDNEENSSINLGILTDKGEDHFYKFIKDIIELDNNSDSQPNIFNGPINNFQLGNQNTMIVTNKNFDYDSLNLALKAIYSLKDDYINENDDKELHQIVDNLEVMIKQKEEPSKIERSWLKLKNVLGSQATTNTISILSTIVNGVALFK